MFADLETVIPHNVRLIQVRPQINPEQRIDSGHGGRVRKGANR